MRILTTPWKNELLELVHQSKQSIKITSPFVKKRVCEEVFAVKSAGVQFELLTDFVPKSYCTGSLDLSAIELILDKGGVVKSYPSLHSKIYLFDNEKAVVGSGNLTTGGLLTNYEYGVFLEDKAIVRQITKDFDGLQKAERSFVLTKKILALAREFVQKYPVQPVRLPKLDLDEAGKEVLEAQGEAEAIQVALSGWCLDVFDCVNMIVGNEFNLAEAYAYEGHLTRKHPKNHNVRDKIRQQLQNLRDLGLLEFVGKGKYRKLWNQ